MRILITGGAGFVGSNLAIALQAAFADAMLVCMDNLYRRGSELNLSRLRWNWQAAPRFPAHYPWLKLGINRLTNLFNRLLFAFL